MKIVLEAFDTSLSVGSIGYGVNNMLYSAIDSIEVEPLSCSAVSLN